MTQFSEEFLDTLDDANTRAEVLVKLVLELQNVIRDDSRGRTFVCSKGLMILDLQGCMVRYTYMYGTEMSTVHEATVNFSITALLQPSEYADAVAEGEKKIKEAVYIRDRRREKAETVKLTELKRARVRTEIEAMHEIAEKYGFNVTRKNGGISDM